MKNFTFQKIFADLIAIAAFVVLSFAYFTPAVFEGRVLAQHDSLAAIGQGQEQRDYMERHNGERTRWINSMFCGMPTYQMSPTYNSTKPQDAAKKLYSLFLPDYVYLLFIMLLGFYILMRAFDASPLISALVPFLTFSSYFLIIIAAGHIWKFITLAYIPPTIAGLVYAYRKIYSRSIARHGICRFSNLRQSHSNELLFLFVMFFMVLAFFVDAVKNKTLPHFLKLRE